MYNIKTNKLKILELKLKEIKIEAHSFFYWNVFGSGWKLYIGNHAMMRCYM